MITARKGRKHVQIRNNHIYLFIYIYIYVCVVTDIIFTNISFYLPQRDVPTSFLPGPMCATWSAHHNYDCHSHSIC